VAVVGEMQRARDLMERLAAVEAAARIVLAERIAEIT
jgi:hypothetical protein